MIDTCYLHELGRYSLFGVNGEHNGDSIIGIYVSHSSRYTGSDLFYLVSTTITKKYTLLIDQAVKNY